VIEREATGDRVAAAAVFRKPARHAFGHLLDVAADPSVDAVLHDLFDGSAGERDNRCAARHGLDHHETERLFPLNREQQRSGPRQQRIFLFGIDFADVLDLAAVDARRHLLFPVLAEDRLHLAGELQTDACAFGGLDREMRPLARRHAAEKRDVVVLLRREGVVVHRDPMMHEPQSRQTFPTSEPRPDRHVVDIRISSVLLRKRWLVRMMHRQHDGHIGEVRQRYAGDVVEMHEVGVQRSVAHRPGRVVEILQLGATHVVDGPIGVGVPRLDSTGKLRIAVRINDDLMTSSVESCREIRDEEFGSTICGRRDCNEWRCNESDAHGERCCKNGSLERRIRLRMFEMLSRPSWN
jgi:hypothetical protein